MTDAPDLTGLTSLELLFTGGDRPTAVTHDSRSVEPGSLYVCLRGETFDGHNFAAEAVAAGAVALLVDHQLPNELVGDTPQIVVDDTRLRVGQIAAELAGHPSRQLTAVGITGTNGKTTTAHLLSAIFEANGWPTGMVGTLHGPRTTPEASDLQQTLAGFVDDDRSAAIVEVSSHALALHRVDGTEFDAVVFTNLGHDHLDLHRTQEEYFRAKASLFANAFAPLGVINADDTYGRLLLDAVRGPEDQNGFRVVPYSVGDVSDVEVSADHHRYRWRGTMIQVGLGGEFNVSNSLAALTTAIELGIDIETIAAGLGDVAPVPGRFEVVRVPGAEQQDFTVVVDYAHTPDGLEVVLESAREVSQSGSAVTVVFGCGGDRDHEKRPAMGAIAGRLADHVIVTSDNPRNEDPASIIDDVIAGVEGGQRDHVSVDPCRRTAIADAISKAQSGDVVVIAGKGHEQTQDLGDQVVGFDDRAVALECLEVRK